MGYIPQKLRDQVAERAHHRCEYCQSQRQLGIDMAVDHVEPVASGGETAFPNLALACGLCNRLKQAFQVGIDPETQTHVALFNPRLQVWSEHFAWDETQTLIVGLTAVGRATVVRLNLNREDRVTARKIWVSAGWHPPKE